MNGFRDAHRQSVYSVRQDWGLTGASSIGADCEIAVVVDVLSFTTTLTVAADRGITVFPYPWRDEQAARFAADRDAILAVGRSRATDGQVSLSPGSIESAPPTRRLVLPSPNGSTLSFQLARATSRVIGVSLRNRQAAAEWLLARQAEQPTPRVAVIAAGERWADGSLRPAVEDLWGAGALIDSLVRGGWPNISPEAHVAAAAYRAIADNLATELADCASGRELIEDGYLDDVRTAAELDRSRAVPLLDNEAFTAA